MGRPAWAHSRRCKSSRKLITANEAKRNCMRATECGEEAWSEAASRWTRTGQMPASAGRVAVGHGEAMSDAASDEACSPRHDNGNAGSALLQAALRRENLLQAFKRVRSNKGAAGVDGLDIDQTARHLVTAWPDIREQLLAGTYRPSPVRRVTIPKPDGGERELGIPTVIS